MILRRIPTDGDGERYIFWCPACKHTHSFLVGCMDEPRWFFNDELESPTFNPSLKLEYKDGTVCHLHIGQGVIRYLKECTHALRNKDVAMVDLPDSA